MVYTAKNSLSNQRLSGREYLFVIFLSFTTVLCAGYSFRSIYPMICVLFGINSTSGCTSFVSYVHLSCWCMLYRHILYIFNDLKHYKYSYNISLINLKSLPKISDYI